MKTDSITFQADSHVAALRKMGEHAFENGFVKESYVDALLEREEEFPTGLEIPPESLGLAIPHADPEHVNEEIFILGVPEEPVEFRSMEDPDETVEAELVLLLVIKETEGYTQFLSSLTKLFQGEEFLKLAREKNEEKILDLVVEKCIE